MHARHMAVNDGSRPARYAGLGSCGVASLRDCQEWGLCTRHFDPLRVMTTPRSVSALTAPNPRVLADEIWAKLLWAGLQLQQTDLPPCSAIQRSATGVAAFRLALIVERV